MPRGRPPDPATTKYRATSVKDEPAQMELLTRLGFTHSLAYQVGSRLLTTQPETKQEYIEVLSKILTEEEVAKINLLFNEEDLNELLLFGSKFLLALKTAKELKNE